MLQAFSTAAPLPVWAGHSLWVLCCLLAVFGSSCIPVSWTNGKLAAGRDNQKDSGKGVLRETKISRDKTCRKPKQTYNLSFAPSKGCLIYISTTLGINDSEFRSLQLPALSQVLQMSIKRQKEQYVAKC